jgi:hypothetical protein
LEHRIVTEQFSGGKEYKNFIDTSGAKLSPDEYHFFENAH